MSLAPDPSRDTIAAIATALGEAAIGVVRISGPGAIGIARQLAPSLPQSPTSHRAYLRRLAHAGRLLDQALVLCFRSPASFTGEDVVELQCHGGVATIQAVLEAVLALGARIAQPGEFARRAFLAGKLDLTQVEAIADVIHARGAAAQRLAQAHLAGALSDAVGGVQQELLALLALVEAAIDFSTEEHVFSLGPDEVARRLNAPIADLERLLNSHTAGRLRHDGVALAIIGLPNAGKSSLLNHLLSEERAIVSEVEGTTRDTIEEQIVLDGLVYRLVDTAGLRDTSDQIEARGIARTRAAIARADAVLLVVDASAPADLRAASLALRSETGERPVGLVWNKSDRVTADPRLGPAAASGEAWVSLTTGEGTQALPDLLRTLAAAAGARLDEDTQMITRARHHEALSDALQSLRRAQEAGIRGLDHELLALDLRQAVDALAQLTGAITSDDVLNRIFEGFCIGK